MFRRHNKRLHVLALILVVTALLFSSAYAQDGAEFVVALNPIEGTLDPHFNTNDPDTSFARALFDYFVEPLPDGTVGPNLASSWEISEDGLTYTFTLVQNATFHDGSPLTSADVVWSFNRLRDPEVGSPAAALLSDITNIEAPDEYTVVFTLGQPNGDFLLYLASRFGLVVKAETEDFSAENISNVGSGPFVLESYSPADRAVFTAYEGYWQENVPGIARMVHLYQPDTNAQVEALTSGEANFIYKVPAELAVTLEGNPDITVDRQTTAAHPVIRLRTDQGPGTDVRVRQAFKLAIDRNALNETVQLGYATVANNDPIAPVYADAYPGDIEQPYDPAQACALLEEAGYGSPANLEMTLTGPDALNADVLATVLQQQLAEGCINVTIEIQPESTYYTTPWLETDLGITGWGHRPSPLQTLEEAYRSGQPYNETRWNSPELDALLDEARATTDVEARRAIFAEIAQLFAEEGPIVVPYFLPVVAAYSNNVSGLDLNPYSGLTDWRTVTLAQ